MSKPNPRYANGARRRRLRARVLREETCCAICGEDVDKTLPAGHDRAPEIDEALPLAQGGDPLDRHNVRLTHRDCNLLRGNDIQRTKANRYRTERCWT